MLQTKGSEHQFAALVVFQAGPQPLKAPSVFPSAVSTCRLFSSDDRYQRFRPGKRNWYEIANTSMCLPPSSDDPVERGVFMRSTKGFSLIELLIVVAIILVIAAIAIPSLLQARMAANEASAVGSLAAMKSAEVTYYHGVSDRRLFSRHHVAGRCNPVHSVFDKRLSDRQPPVLVDSWQRRQERIRLSGNRYYDRRRRQQLGLCRGRLTGAGAFHREPRLLLDERWRVALTDGQSWRCSGQRSGRLSGISRGAVNG